MTGFLQDFRHALRRLRIAPGFAMVVALTLALGIGATTAMFTLVDGALFRSLPYWHGDELVSIGVLAPIIDGEFLFAGNFLSWRRDQKPFSGFTSSTGVSDCDLTEDHPVRLACGNVDANFLPTFEIQPILGRNFTREEDRPNAPRVALLTYGFWQSRFAGDRRVVDRTISLDGMPTRVLGILPKNFEFPTLAQVNVLVPEALDESIVQRNQLGPIVRVYGRMKPQLGLGSATAQLQPLFRSFVDAAPPPFRKVLRLQVRPIRDLQIHDSRSAAWLLLISSLAVLLIASTNAAGLILARSSTRRRELAVRAAIGASRIRLFQQRLAESVLLAFIGAAAGIGLAWVIVRGVVALAPANIPRLAQATINWRVLLFTVVVSLSVGIIFGAVPALEKPVIEMLVATTALATHKARFRQTLLIAQVGMTVVLLAGALVFLRSLRNMQSQPLGLNTQNVVTAEITLGQQRYSSAASRLAFSEQLEKKLKELPGATAVALSDSLPPAVPARTMPFIALHAEGRPEASPEEGIGGIVGWRSVTPEYFSALGIPLIRGRGFQEQDRRPGNGAIILNEALAQKIFSREEPLGKIIRFHLEDQRFTAAFTVVGVTGNTQNQGVGGLPGPEYYMVRQHTVDDVIFRYPDSQRISLIVRSALNPRSVAMELKDSVASLDSTIPVQTTTLGRTVYRLTERPRFSAALLALFAVMGVLLVAAGVYGLVSLLVAERTQEIAIHVALGANPAALSRKIIVQACSWIAVGAGAGILCSLPAERSVSAMLFGIKSDDPATLVSAVLGLLIVGIVAAYIPARRAAKVDPMVALRYE
jgi:putative ABC transport system permease protein